MKHRLFIFVLVAYLILSCGAPVVSASFGSFSNDAIVDGALLLTEEEKSEISSGLSDIREKYGIDAAIYTEFSMLYGDAERAANSIYDSLDYGAGDDASGVLLYVSAHPREYYLISNGSCYSSVVNDRGLVYIENNVLPHLKNNDYQEAFNQFAVSVEYLFERAANNEMYNAPPTKVVAITVLLIFGVPLLLAFALTYGKILKMNTAVKAVFANNYVKNGGLSLTKSKDIFLYSTTTKVRRQSSSSSSGGSRSGGRGGRGGSY